MNEHETVCMAVADEPLADPTIEKIRRMLAARRDVACAYVFGSRATGKAGEGSDYDIGVVTTGSTPGERLAVQLDLAAALERVAPCDLVDLEGAAPVLLNEVLRDGKAIVCNSHAKHHDFLVSVPRKLDEYFHLHRIQMRYLKERYSHGKGHC